MKLKKKIDLIKIFSSLFNSKSKLSTVIPIILTTLTFDQITKWMILFSLVRGQTIKVFSFFNIVLVFNHGVSFGMFRSHGMLGMWILIIVATSLCVWLCFLVHESNNKIEYVSYSLIIGGAIGNIFDRFLYGGVVDFLDFHIRKHHWPAFNLADSAIVVGAILTLSVQLWFSLIKKNATLPSKKASRKTAKKSKIKQKKSVQPNKN